MREPRAAPTLQGPPNHVGTPAFKHAPPSPVRQPTRRGINELHPFHPQQAQHPLKVLSGVALSCRFRVRKEAARKPKAMSLAHKPKTRGLGGSCFPLTSESIQDPHPRRVETVGLISSFASFDFYSRVSKGLLGGLKSSFQ